MTLHRHSWLWVGSPPLPPSFDSVTPSSGDAAGGTSVVLRGHGFAPATDVQVDFVSVPFVVDSDEQITITTLDHDVGIAPIVIITPGYTLSIGSAYTFVLDSLSFISCTPNHGDPAGTTSVTLSGTGFHGVTAIEIEPYIIGVTFVVVDDETITLDLDGPGLGAAGGDSLDFRIVRTISIDEVTGSAAFTFDQAAATVVGISPSTGTISGGDHVVIEVDDSTGCTSAALDGVNLTSFAIDDGTHVSGDTVAHAAGAVDVTVTNAGGTSSPLVNGYTYAAPAAVVSAISPIYGSTSGGTVVNITVDDSTGATGAKVNGVSVTSFSIIDGTTVQGTTGASSVGASDVVVTNGGGDSAPLVGAFVYCANDPTAWWEGSYGGAPWLPTASDGTSGGTIPIPRNLVTFGSHAAAGVGSAVDSKTPATFNGTTQAMEPTQSTGQTLGASATAFTILVMMRTVATQAASGTWFHDPGIVMDAGGNGGLVITNSGLVAGLDGPTVSTAALAQPSPGSWFMGAMRYDATHLDCRLNATDATQVAATAHATFASALYIGVNYQESQYVHGEMLTIKMWDRRLSGAELAAEYALLKLKYPSASLP